MTRVKICGITNLGDAQDAVAAGADALGFVFAKSPRRIEPAKAKAIIRQVGPWIAAVGVFVNEKASEIRRIAKLCGLTAVQLHGDESPAFVKALKNESFYVIKAVRVAESKDLNGLGRYKPDAFLFDAKVSGVYGGTGKSFDWAILRSKKWAVPFIISGGLVPGNVARPVKLLPLYGVDASSGVERSPGKKDSKLVRELIRNAKKV
jgi:phosphoribosylanthranilate isomerase